MKTALIALLILISIVLIVVVLMQPSKTNGLAGFIGGGSTDTYFSKNKTKTKEAMLARITVISAILFALDIIAIQLVK